MKKSVIMTIAVVYVLAIVAVSFLGMKMFIYNPEIPVEEIICRSEDKVSTQKYAYVKNTNPKLKYDGTISIKYDENYDNQIVVDCYVKPDNSTVKTVSYWWDKSAATNHNITIIEKDGCLYVKFNKTASINIIVSANDDSKKSITIKVSAKPSREDI